jgi:hypothetical protein
VTHVVADRALLATDLTCARHEGGGGTTPRPRWQPACAGLGLAHPSDLERLPRCTLFRPLRNVHVRLTDEVKLTDEVADARRGMRSTRPPWARTASRPTISSAPQWAPFTSTSGARTSRYHGRAEGPRFRRRHWRPGTGRCT